MKRDMDLIRDILLAIEEHPQPEFVLTHDYIVPVEASLQTFIGHLRVMEDAGYLMPLHDPPHDPTTRVRISNSGYDFLDSVRDPKIWRKTKEAAQKAGGWTLGIIGQIAAGIIKAKLAQMGFPVD